MKDSVMKEYIERDGKTLRVEVYYSLGGPNYFTSKTESRGYYLSVTPVERTVKDGYTTESFSAFSGIKELLVEVKRKSNKAEKQAEELTTKEKIEKLVEYVLNKQAA